MLWRHRRSSPRSLAWRARRCDQAFGYSCAGAVHRVFAAGRWWVDHGGSAWPTCETARRKLLHRWHPHFGDRRQEIAFAGVDVDVDRVCAALDACLLSEAEALEMVAPSERQAGASIDAPHRVGLH